MFQYHDPDGQDLPRNTYSRSVEHTAYTESEVEQLCQQAGVGSGFLRKCDWLRIWCWLCVSILDARAEKVTPLK